MITTRRRTTQMLREWFSSLELGDRYRLVSLACCSNPNPQLYTDAAGNTYLRCANCMCRM